MNDFEGDLLLLDTPDGGDIVIENGLLQPDRGFATAVYISLFGGNKEESGKVKTNKTWWGNTLEGTEAEKIVSRFQHIITAMPLSIKNIKAAEEAAKLDLKWIVGLGIADKIEADGRTGEKGFFSITVTILKDTNTVFENSYSTLWAAGGDYGI
jgi:phage gp46-like protein